MTQINQLEGILGTRSKSTSRHWRQWSAK